MSDRDELADLLADNITIRSAVDAILAAGYRKTQTITTVEEVDALPKATAILDANGSPFINDGDDQDPWCSPVESFEGGPCWFDSSSILLPATVLHEPRGTLL